MTNHLQQPVARGQRGLGVKPNKRRSGKSIENRAPKRDAPLKEQESPKVPVPTLSPVNMNRPHSVNTAPMPNREVLVAQPADAPIAAELVSIDDATPLNVAKQDSRNSPATGVPRSQEERSTGAPLHEREEGLLTPSATASPPAAPTPPRPSLPLTLIAEGHVGLVDLNLAAELQLSETRPLWLRRRA